MKPPRRDLTGGDGPAHRPLAALRALRPAAAAAAPPPAAEAPAEVPCAERAGLPSGRVVLRVERRGHGGKTVTVVEGFGGDREALARELRQALGAGARADETIVVVQGEHVDRLEALLRARGVRDVVRGNR